MAETRRQGLLVWFYWYWGADGVGGVKVEKKEPWMFHFDRKLNAQ